MYFLRLHFTKNINLICTRIQNLIIDRHTNLKWNAVYKRRRSLICAFTRPPSVTCTAHYIVILDNPRSKLPSHSWIFVTVKLPSWYNLTSADCGSRCQGFKKKIRLLLFIDSDLKTYYYSHPSASTVFHSMNLHSTIFWGCKKRFA